MSYNKSDIELIIKYHNNKMSNKTIAIFINKQSNHKFTEQEIEQIINNQNKQPLKKEPVESEPDQYGKVYNTIAGIALNPQKRKRAKLIALLSLFAFVAALVCLGIFVSWTPVIVIASIIVGIVVLFALTMLILFKTGLAEKIMERHGF
jgi:hypothetical protein